MVWYYTVFVLASAFSLGKVHKRLDFLGRKEALLPTVSLKSKKLTEVALDILNRWIE